MAWRVSVACALAVAVGCGGGLRSLRAPAVPRHELLSGVALGVGEPQVSMPDAAEVMAVSPEMRAFLDAHVDPNGTDAVRLRQLAAAIVNPETFGLRYDEHTRTASETFHDRQGNCLSFATMFVVMARILGLEVEFQEVDIPPDWSLENETFVLNRHVNVFVNLGLAGTLAVDFNIADFRTKYDMRKISDTRALAHYYNNAGVESMQNGDLATALACFRKALADSDSGFSPAWTNLGTLHMRAGRLLHAEAAYLQALEADRWNLVAMSNLARVHERMGEAELAAADRRRVIHHRHENPYYRYQLARKALEVGELDAAIGHLKFAIRKKRNEDQFYALLGLCHHRLGKEGEARYWLARARDVAASEVDKGRYSSKLDALAREQRHDSP